MAAEKAAGLARVVDGLGANVAELERAAASGAPDVAAAAEALLLDVEVIRGAVGKIRKKATGSTDLVDALDVVAVRASTLWARAARVLGASLADSTAQGRRNDLHGNASTQLDASGGREDAGGVRLRQRTVERYRRLARVPEDVFARLLEEALAQRVPVTQGGLLEHAPPAVRRVAEIQPNHKVTPKGAAGRIRRAVQRVKDKAGERSPLELRAWVLMSEVLSVELFQRYAASPAGGRGPDGWKGSPLDVLESLLHAQHAVAVDLARRYGEGLQRDEVNAIVRTLLDWRERLRDLRELRATGLRPVKDDEAVEAAALVFERWKNTTGDRAAQDELTSMAEEVRGFGVRLRAIREGRADPQLYRMAVSDEAGGRPSPGVVATPHRFGGPGRS